MIRHFGHSRSWSGVVFSAVLGTGLVGCHHRQAQPVILPAQTAVPIEVAPTPATLPLVEAPKTKLPPVPIAREEPNPKKAKKQRTKSLAAGGSPPAGAPAPAQSASATVPVPPTQAAPHASEGPATEGTAATTVASAKDDSIGVFSVGGDQSPRVKQDASNLIASNERRLAQATGDKVHADPALLSKVRNFQKEAQQALASGDAEGARTLATKGKLLLDDLDRGVASQ